MADRDFALDAVLQVCVRHGFGRVMQFVSSEWETWSTAHGCPGGHHTVGPCQDSLTRAGVRDSMELLAAWETLSDEAREAALATVRAVSDVE